jgi:hypothetical protein
MFRASPDSSQIDLFSNLEQFLCERDQEQLNDPNAWHNVILDQVVKRVSEERFVELFDEATGRPNAPLRVLVGMLILKEGFGWRDEALFEAVHFHLLVRRALGLLKLTDEVPVASTYYLFKPRWYAHPVETGVNRLQEVFPELTRDQAKRLGVVGEQRRMAGVVRLRNAMVGLRPSRRGILGSQPRWVLAWVISGWRWRGSSWGRGSWMRGEWEPVRSRMVSANSIMLNSPGLPRLMGPARSSGLFMRRTKPSMRSST